MRSWISLLGLMLSPAVALAAPMLRDDLRKASPYFCEESTAALKDLGIYDAQMELAFVKDAKDPEAFARDFAVDNQHRGFAYGTCKDQRQWIVSSPSPQAVLQIIDRAKSLKVDAKTLKSICGSYDVDGILKAVEAPVSILKGVKPGSIAKDIPFEKDSYTTITLTCHPKDQSREGAELWALVSLSAPESIDSLATEKDFQSWIAELRQRNKLAPLEMGNPSLQNLADESAAVKNLRHPRELLLKRKSHLKLMHIELLGENRAAAPNFKGLAELLWNSPTHRRLLLNPKANQIALKTTDKGDEKLLVMILARK